MRIYIRACAYGYKYLRPDLPNNSLPRRRSFGSSRNLSSLLVTELRKTKLIDSIKVFAQQQESQSSIID